MNKKLNEARGVNPFEAMNVVAVSLYKRSEGGSGAGRPPPRCNRLLYAAEPALPLRLINIHAVIIAAARDMVNFA
jgi:hypothetical protein